MNALAQERALSKWLGSGFRSIGQIVIAVDAAGHITLCHRDDAESDGLTDFKFPEDAAELARFDDEKNYRPLKTAPTLQHGWKLAVANLAELRRALDLFYPGRLAVFLAFEQNQLVTTSLRNTLERQTGMYRIAARIEDKQADELVGRFCRSDGGCLRTILWRRDAAGTTPSTRLPPEKFDPRHDQSGRGVTGLPLLCQEACNLLVAEARTVVQANR